LAPRLTSSEQCYIEGGGGELGCGGPVRDHGLLLWTAGLPGLVFALVFATGRAWSSMGTHCGKRVTESGKLQSGSGVMDLELMEQRVSERGGCGGLDLAVRGVVWFGMKWIPGMPTKENLLLRACSPPKDLALSGSANKDEGHLRGRMANRSRTGGQQLT